ncbi:terpene synthase family protein [Streptomyces sp. NPDC057909]|uniref:terpene synthase family protein n=1 Tax=Streptomyces sp. NPDC057909 TaxID=3346277 RepID=UPI0036EF6926
MDRPTVELNEALGGAAKGNFSHSLSYSLNDLCRKTFPEMGSGRARMVAHLVALISAREREDEIRRRGNLVDLGTYISMRRDTVVSMLPMLDLAEYSLGVQVNEVATHLPQHETILHATADTVAWMNDLMAIERDVSIGDMSNIVLVLANAANCSDIQAQGIVERLIKG